MPGLVFVVDSHDRGHIQNAHNELTWILDNQSCHVGTRHACPILILANKQDLPNAMTATEIRDGLDLSHRCPSTWYNLPPIPLSWCISDQSDLCVIA